MNEGLDFAERTKIKFLMGYAHRLLGETALEANPDEAIHHFTRAIAVFQEIRAENELALACAGYGRLHKKEGDIPKAREYLTRAIDIFERLGTLVEPAKAREDLDGLPLG